MKTARLVLLLITLGAALGARAAQPFIKAPAPFEPSAVILAAPDADAAFKPLPAMTGMEGLMAAVAGKTTMEERTTAMRHHIVKFLRAGIAFCQKYPEDPRRWRVVLMLDSAVRDLAAEDGTPKEKLEGIEWAPATMVAWRQEVKELAAAAEHAPDAPPEVKFRAESQQPNGLRALTTATQAALKAGQPADFPALKAEIIRLGAKYPTVEALGQQVSLYFVFQGRAKAAKETLVAEAQEFAASPNAPVRKAALAELDKLTAFDKAFELTFTAVDGTKVDIKDYRGKVVLIDFWATWCGPCIAELPNIKQVYAAYHDKGFEIIGVSLENARLAPDDTAEQVAAKHAKAQKILNEFTAKSAMPWPQYYDGKFWKNDISTRFGIASIPAMFLIDQDGKIVSTEARGPKLEAEVKRLLKL